MTRILVTGGAGYIGSILISLLLDEKYGVTDLPPSYRSSFYVKILLDWTCPHLWSIFYAPGNENGILWSDSDLGVEWPVKEPLLSPKDSQYPCLKDISPDCLPDYGG